jgi:hypothetical protein
MGISFFIGELDATISRSVIGYIHNAVLYILFCKH